MADRVKLVAVALLVVVGIFAWRDLFSYGATTVVVPAAAARAAGSEFSDNRWTDAEASVAVAESAWGAANGVAAADCYGEGTYTVGASGQPAYQRFRCVAFDANGEDLGAASIEVTGPDAFALPEPPSAEAAQSGAAQPQTPPRFTDPNGTECDAAWAHAHSGHCQASDGA